MKTTLKNFKDQILELQPGKYRDYVEAGKQMDKRQALSLLVGMYMDYCGISMGYRTVVYDLGWATFKKYAECEKTEFTGDEPFCSVLSRLNQEYAENAEKYDEYDIAIIDDDDDYLSFCMDILNEHEGDHECCAAICYGMNCFLNE